MKFMILIYSNPQSRETWASFSRAQQAEGLDSYAELAGDLERSGELIVTHALADPAHGRRVVPAPTDGPFAEVKEHLAGFFLVDCADMDRAMEIAARVPEAGMGLVEVRPAIDAADLLR